MGQDLGVGVRGESAPPGREFVLDLLVVLDDAVVDHGQTT
jgi:hypothetical protein